ncbi:MAG: ankyrin repeat domain-containing protein [Acidobacteria bacterium]|nr:ankyrin repeat domain-containing protein [Acidobacteriota bacterium]
MHFRNCFATFVALCVSGFPLGAEVTPRNFYDAIRDNDIANIQSMLSSGAPVDLRDARGTTPLMHAAAIGSIEMMKVLLKAGADVNSRNGLDATPLVWAASNPDKAKLLMEAGAQVNVVTKMGRTPLMMAASSSGSAVTLKRMIDKGANTELQDVRGNTALLDAASANETESVRLLLERKADINAGDFAGVTALGHAAGHSNVEMTRLLLAKGADVNASHKRELKVRNGLIAASHLTPLMTAAPAASIETIKALLDAGADVNRKDVRGMTALMLAVASDTAKPETVRLLLQKGADPNVKGVDGQTALDWAKKFANPKILAMLGSQVSQEKSVVRLAANQSVDVRKAIAKAVPLLEATAKEYFKMSGCAGCHHQHVIGMAVPAASRAGITVDEGFSREQVQVMKAELMQTRDALLQDVFISADGLVFSLMGLGDRGYPADELTDAMVSAIAARQTEHGDWRHFPITRPPLESSQFVVTAFGVRAMQRYSFPARQAEMQARIAKTRQWLMHTQPSVPFERAFQVLGLQWSGAEKPVVQRAVSELRKLQRPDGGWPQLATLPADAYGTAVALYAMRQAGVSAQDPAFQRGVRYLVSRQKNDGSWYVASRAPKVQPYFQSGFPYNHDQWISAATTAFAVTALADALEPARQTAALKR